MKNMKNKMFILNDPYFKIKRKDIISEININNILSNDKLNNKRKIIKIKNTCRDNLKIDNDQIMLTDISELLLSEIYEIINGNTKISIGEAFLTIENNLTFIAIPVNEDITGIVKDITIINEYMSVYRDKLDYNGRNFLSELKIETISKRINNKDKIKNLIYSLLDIFVEDSIYGYLLKVRSGNKIFNINPFNPVFLAKLDVLINEIDEILAIYIYMFENTNFSIYKHAYDLYSNNVEKTEKSIEIVINSLKNLKINSLFNNNKIQISKSTISLSRNISEMLDLSIDIPQIFKQQIVPQHQITYDSVVYPHYSFLMQVKDYVYDTFRLQINRSSSRLLQKFKYSNMCFGKVGCSLKNMKYQSVSNVDVPGFQSEVVNEILPIIFALKNYIKKKYKKINI